MNWVLGGCLLRVLPNCIFCSSSYKNIRYGKKQIEDHMHMHTNIYTCMCASFVSLNPFFLTFISIVHCELAVHSNPSGMHLDERP